MMPFNNTAAAIFSCFLVLFSASSSLADDGSGALKKLIERATTERPNPHIGLPCMGCHGVDNPAPAPDGSVPFKGGSASAACSACHDASTNIHPVGQAPSMAVPGYLPLTAGKVDCSTCHDMHMEASADTLLRGFANGRYKVRQDLCFDCHGSGFMKKNPHVNQKERERCAFCHASEPTSSDSVKTVRFRYGILRTCNFCHDMAGRSHPQNVDPSISPPTHLPRDIDGSVTCATCHNPHGSTETLHFLRPDYIQTVETATGSKPHEGDCEACHLTVPDKGQPIKEVLAGMKFGGNITLLCNSCHGTHSVHPTDIAPGAGMKTPKDLPLDERGRISCITCHDVNWKGEVSLRLPGSGEQDEASMHALCISCHDKTEYAESNPHLSIMSGQGCLFCHDRVPDVRTDTVHTVSFITSMRLVCIQCHSPYPHPASSEHLTKPRPEMVVDEHLPLDTDGHITCVTCHDPHTGGESGEKEEEQNRLRLEGAELCGGCHTGNR